MRNIYKIFNSLLLIFSCCSSYAQSWNWALNAMGDHQYADVPPKIAVDHHGNSYIVGYYKKQFKLGDSTLFYPSDYNSEIFLSKIDSSGNVRWLKSIDNEESYRSGVAITLDDYGNCYISSAINSKVFVAKYDSLGNNQWMNNFDNKYYGYGKGIALDQDENVYVVGEYGNYIGGVFFSKLDHTGKTIWIKNIESTCHTNGCSGSSIVVDALGNSYITGVFQCDTLNVGGIKLAYHGSWGDKTFIAKYSPNGEVLWAKSPYGKTAGEPQLEITEKKEIILAGSFFSDIIDFDGVILTKREGGNDISPYLVKFNEQGQVVWAKNGNTWKGNPRDIVTDYEGNTYLAGISFGNYGGSYMDFHIEKYDQSGQLLWNRNIMTGNEYVFGLGVDILGGCYIVGHSDVKGVFGEGFMNEANSTFVAKLNTESTTHLRPYKPWLIDFWFVCDGGSIPKLEAQGHNITWYDSPQLDKVLHRGTAYLPTINKTDTFYVTQTIDSKQSWAKRVIVYISELKDFTIANRNDTLYTPYTKGYTYEWFYGDSLIVNSKLHYLIPDTSGVYTVKISDRYCSKQNSILYSLPLAIDELVDNTAQVSLYPNPSENTIYLLKLFRIIEKISK